MKKQLRPSSGALLDIDSLEIADQYLSVANNVNTRKGFPSRIGGRRIAYPVSAGHAPNDPLHLRNLFLNTFNWWMSFGASNIYGIEGGTPHDISFAGQHTVANTSDWVSALLNGIPVFTNGADPLLYWNGDGATHALAVTGWPVGTVCKAVAAFRFHLFAMNISNGSGTFENMIMWSAAADPGALPSSWTPLVSNEAGSAILADTPGRCICGVPLQTQLLVYKPTSCYAVEYVGQPPLNIFTVRPTVRSTGALSPHTVIDLDTKHLVMGNDDIVLFDGQTVTSIAENRIKTFLANQIDETNAHNAFIIRDLSKREVWVCVPESGSTFATVAHIWDERRDTWVTRDLNQVRYGTTGFVSDTTINKTWDAAAATWDASVGVWGGDDTSSTTSVVTAEPNTIYMEDTPTLVSITGRIARYDLGFDDDTMVKVTSRVWVEGSGPGLIGMLVRLGARDSTDEDITWGVFVSRQAGGTPYEVTGRYISVEVKQTGTNAWTVDRITIEASYNGTN
jgi:hypothetical protein